MKLVPQYAFKHLYKRLAALALDACGSVFASSRSDSRPDLSRIKKILAIRLDHLGDVIMTRPALAALHRAMPHASIDLAVSAEIAPLVRRDPWIHEVIPVRDHWFSRQTTCGAVHKEKARLLDEIRSKNYDLAIDFRGDLRIIHLMKQAGIPYRLGYGITGGGFWLTHTRPYNFELHQVFVNGALLETVGIKLEIKSQPFRYSDEEKNNFLRGFPSLASNAQNRVIVHTGAGFLFKQWAPEKFRELLNRLLQENSRIQIVLIGTEKEKTDFRWDEDPRVLDLRGKTSIEELPILLDLAGFYIGNDSGPGHFAAAQGLPGVVIFSGVNNPSVWRPWSDKIKIVHPREQHASINRLAVVDVYRAVRAAQNSEVKK